MEKNNKFQYIGLLAATLSLISFYSLVIFNFNIENTLSLSWLWLLSGIITQFFWLIYAYANNILPSKILAPLMIVGFISLIFLKLKLETNILPGAENKYIPPQHKSSGEFINQYNQYN